MKHALAAAGWKDAPLPNKGGAAGKDGNPTPLTHSAGTPAAHTSEPETPRAAVKTQDSVIEGAASAASQQKHPASPAVLPFSSVDQPDSADVKEVAQTPAGPAQELLASASEPKAAAVESLTVDSQVDLLSSGKAASLGEEAVPAGKGSWSEASNSGDDDDAPDAGSGWLQSMLAAHKRVLTNATGGPAKRQALARSAEPLVVKTALGPAVRREQQVGEAEPGNADSLSLGDSMP
jgi:hypothetical protein